MRPWRLRGEQVASLFNPAFCGVLLTRTLRSYERESAGEHLPFALVFLILPFLLNTTLRASLPRTRRTPFDLWLTRTPEVRIDLNRKVQVLVTITRESLLFLAVRNYVQIGPGGRVEIVNLPRVPSNILSEHHFLQDAVGKSAVLARLLASGPPEHILIRLGLSL